MSQIAHILALYLSLLTLFPCADKAEAAISADVSVQAAHTHGVNEPGSDLCSPLCLCSCCGISFQAPVINKFSLKKLSIIYVYTALRATDAPFRSPGAVCHPPKA